MDNKIQHVTNTIIQQAMLPLYFNADKQTSIEVLKSLYKAGIRAVEYTNRGDAAFKNFEKLMALKNSQFPALSLGIGTIKNFTEYEKYINAGADFIVSPGLVPEVAAHAVANDIFYAPGCMTPTEIIAAENLGIKFIKLFPGDILGPSYLNNIKPVFPGLYFMPTGGVDTSEENIRDWFDAGVSAVGMGSKLISKQLMEEKNYSKIEHKTIEILQIINSIKK